MHDKSPMVVAKSFSAIKAQPKETEKGSSSSLLAICSLVFSSGRVTQCLIRIATNSKRNKSKYGKLNILEIYPWVRRRCRNDGRSSIMVTSPVFAPMRWVALLIFTDLLVMLVTTNVVA